MNRNHKGQFSNEKNYNSKSQMRTCQLKFYVEQCNEFNEEQYEQMTKDEQIVYSKELLSKILKNMTEIFSQEEYLVWGVIHDSDTKGDEFWEPSIEKMHTHIYIINLRNKRPQVRVFFRMLDIGWRDTDEVMWKKGIDNIADRHQAALYATHDTLKAQSAGKAQYDISCVYTNNFEEYMELRSDGEKAQESVKKADWSMYDRAVYALGYSLGDWDEWYGTLPRCARENQNKIRICREQYNKGIEKKIEENSHITRVSIYIQGGHNIGKTTATECALKEKRHLDISGGGTGKFDRLTPVYEAITLHDSTVSKENLLAMADDRMCNVYHRNKGNSYFCGDTFVVTSNLDFETWCSTCGVKTRNAFLHQSAEDMDETIFNPEYLAIRSRFFICHIDKINGVNQLVCTSPNERGSEDEMGFRLAEYVKFRDKFNACIAGYTPCNRKITFNELNGIEENNITTKTSLNFF